MLRRSPFTPQTASNEPPERARTVSAGRERVTGIGSIGAVEAFAKLVIGIPYREGRVPFAYGFEGS